jgi:hypothetical protein
VSLEATGDLARAEAHLRHYGIRRGVRVIRGGRSRAGRR